jgi:hypothetical protein
MSELPMLEARKAAVEHGREKTELGRIVVERLVIAGENRMRKQYQSNLPSLSSFP